MLLTSQLRYFIYGSFLSASLISLAPWVSADVNDGVFGDYFRNIINMPCTDGFIITGFDTSSANYGKRTCTSIATVLGKSTGNVGIGTESPAAKLDVAGGIIGNYLTIRPQNTTIEWWEIKLEKGPSNTKDAYIDNAADRLRIHNGTSEMMSADLVTGNIGIGTSTPTAKLEVAGTTKTNKLQLGDKFILSAVGDTHGNDNWIRMFDVNNQTYSTGGAYGNGWIAAANFYARDYIYARVFPSWRYLLT